MRIVKNVAKRMMSLLLALTMVLSMLPMMATTAQAAISGVVVDGLYGSGDGSWSLSGTTITGTVTSTENKDKCGKVTGYTQKNSTLTLTNKSGEAKTLSFSWSLSNGGSVSFDDTAQVANGAYNAEFAKDATLKIKVTSHASNADATTLTLSGIALADKGKKYDITFKTGANGDYTVNGVAVTAERTDQGIESTTKYTMVALPHSGFKLRHWEDGEGNILSESTTYEMYPNENITIKPVFIKADTAMFGVASKTFYDLNEADAYATSSGNHQINLLNNGTLYSGNYTISAGNTLLIPFDGANTCYKDAPESTGSAGFLNLSVTEEYTVPVLFRNLKMANGAHITVNGAISVSAKNAAGISTGAAESNKCGAVTGPYGQIQMEGNSSITVNGALYAWGFITGEGTVTANSGAKVYELMQVTEFRGGTILKDLAADPDNTGNIFPLSQYYVQNIEVPLTLHAGATEYGYTAILAKGMGKQSSTAEFIGANGMFSLTDGYVTKQYVGTTDRLLLDIYGNVALSQLSLGIGEVNMDSSKFVLPITNNVTIGVHSHQTVLNQKVALLPGVEVYVDKGAELVIESGMEAFVYDATEWNGKKFVHGGQNIAPVVYAPGKKVNRSTTLVDCLIDINGTATVKGDLYTTTSGAQIISSEGTGEIYFTNAPGKKTNTYQYVYPGNGVTTVPITPVKLLNGDKKTYVPTAGNTIEGDIYLYDKDAKKWFVGVTAAYNANGGAGDLTTIFDTNYAPVKDEDIENNSILVRNQFLDWGLPLALFDGFEWDGYKAYEWNTNKNGGGNTGYQPYDSENVEGVYFFEHFAEEPKRPSAITFYAQWQENYVTVVLKDSDGKELKRFENQRADSPVNMLENVELPNLEKGFSRKWRPVVNGEEQELIDTLPAKFPKENTDYVHTPVAIPYEIKYELNGGTLSEGKVNPATYTIEDEITLFNPTREGYDFTGWTGTGIDGVSTDVTITKGSTGDRTYTATWTVKQYKAIFNAGEGATFSDGSTTKEVLVNYGETPVAPENPSKFEHTFAGWSPVLAPMGVNGATYTATYDINKYTIKFVNEDGTELQSDEVAYGEMPKAPADPTKAATAQYSYTFNSWTPAITEVTGEATYTATYNKTLNKYTITFVNEDGTELQSSKVAYGETPAYTGAEPTKAKDAQYTYTFAGWDEEIVAVTGEATYTATYNKTVNQYTVTFYDENGNELQSKKVAYGETPVYTGAEPTKAATAQYSYTFAGWTPEIAEVSGDATYTATYTPVVNKYTIKFVDEDGKTVLQSSEVEYGSTPTPPANPTKAATAQYSYTFNGWTPAIIVVAGEATYTATYTETVNEYTITFVNEDGTELQSSKVAYGEPPVYTGAEPTKAATAQYTYTFVGWDKEIVAVTGEATYTAKYSSTVNQYKVTFDAGVGAFADGSKTIETMVEYGKKPAEPETPAKAGYTFNGWDPELKTVDENGATYTAVYTANDVGYTVETYIMGLDGVYGEPKTEEKPATTDSEVFVEPEVKEGFTVASDSVLSGTVAADGNTVLKVYYSRNKYTIAFSVDGQSYTTRTHYYGAEINDMPNPPTKEGHSFVDWNPAVPATMPAENMNVEAQWKINQYTITFNTDGGSEIASITRNYGENVTAPADPTKVGHSFAGWVTRDSTGSENTYNIPDTMPAQNVTAYAKWTVKQYTITFKDVDGSEIYTVTKNYGEEVGTVANPSKTGYTFAGWDKDIPVTMPAGDMTITAQWTAIEYAITYYLDGGTADNPATYTIEDMFTLTNPTKEGYTFQGWTGSNGNDPQKEVTIVAGSTGAKEYIAKWTINQYEITFDTDGGSTIDPITQDYNSAVTAPADPKKEGYTFAGWDKNIPATMPAEDVAIKALWTVNQYDAVFSAVDGKFADGSTSKTVPTNFGETPAAPDEKPTKEGYSFIGWTPELASMGVNGATYTAVYEAIDIKYTVETYTMDVNGQYGDPVYVTKKGETDSTVSEAPVAATGFTLDTANSVLEGKVAADGSLVLKVYYSRNQYNVIYKVDGNHYEEKNYFYGADVTALAAPTKEGYTFSGWSEIPSTMPAENVEVTGTFTINKYTVTWTDEKGNEIRKEEDVEHGSNATAPAVPEKPGYTGSWSGSSDNVTGNVEIQATYKPNNYSIGWFVDGEAYTWTEGEEQKTTTVVVYDTAITIPAVEPTKEGYTFQGWYTGEYGTGLKITNETTYKFGENGDGIQAMSVMAEDVEISGNTALYAHFTINSYVVTWNVDGAKTEETYNYGAAIVKPADPSKEGYTFTGWSPAVPSTMPASNQTFTATWKINQYTITFNTEGGTAVTAIKQDYGTAVTAPADPTKTGYSFDGWDVEIPATMPAENVTITAKWTANEYTVTWNVDNDETRTSTQTYDAVVQLYAAPNKAGYEFAGWFTELVGGTQVTPDTKYEIAGNTTYYAQWEAIKYEVTWIVDDATHATTQQAYETNLVLPAVPQKSGYTFLGWFTAETGGEQVTGELVYKTLGTSTYYAHWDETDYVIDYKGVDGAVHGNAHGYSLDKLPMTLLDAAKDNFVFMGWTCERLGYTEPTKGWKIPAGTIDDLTITAHFEKAYASVTSGSTTTYYLTLAEAVAAAQSGDTVKLLDSMTGAGMVVDKDITIDFGGNTYTFDISIGSTGTETLGFQLMVGKNVTLKNGELKADPTAVNAQGKVNKVLIQNYANLNLEGMTLTANKNTLYNLSINSGNVAIKNCAIEAALGKVAFDVCKYASYAAPTVTAENCTVEGIVEVTGGNLTVNGGEYTSNDTDVFVVDSGLLTINDANVAGGSKNQSTAVWAKNNGKVVINGGSFTVGADETAVDGYNDLIYARDNAVIEINGGTFDGPAKNGTSQKFLLNLKDGSNATIIVKGGTYIGFDPQDSGTEPAGKADDFTADGFIAVKNDEGNYVVIAHTHTYSYTASGSVITETCFDGCRHQATAELEKNASASLVYTGSAIEPYGVAYSDSWIGGDLAVAYENNVDAGTATAKISVDTATASATFDITNADLTDVTVSQKGTLVYNEKEQTPEVTTRATAVNGQKVTFTYGTEEGTYGAMPAFETVGTYTVYFKAVAPNHNAAIGSFTVTVVQGTPAYTVPTGLTGAVGQTLAAVELPVGWSWNEAATELTVEGEQKFAATFTHENSNYKSVSVDVAVDVFMPTITFANTGDVAIEPIKQAYNTDVTAPAAPTKEGYSFIRWDKEIPAKMPAENVTINAQWEINQYTITFANTGDSKIDPIKQDYGTAVTAPETPTKEGYTFAGWDVTIPATMPAGDMTITAQWTVNQYTITFVNTGDSTIDPIKQDYGTAVTAPADPTKTGYNFAGWNMEVPATMPAENVTIKAQWTINSYTITFDTDGGSEIKPITQDYNTEVKRPSNPSKEGYTFDGWDVTIPATMPAENVTITAKWKVNQYTITFNTVGGTEIGSITQDYGTAVTAPADPTKTGYDFAGWDVTIPATMPAGNMTITAQWKINQYTITFNTDGGNAIDAIVQNYNTAVTAPAAPKKTGYTFVGWDKEIPTTMPAENVTITAQWKINQYTITFNTDGGTAVAAIKQDYGTAVTAPADPTKTGYDFAGWDVKIPATMPAENVTITAKWTINSYTITFDTDGGSEIKPITQDYNTAVKAPANPTKEGYTFIGWEPAVPATMPAGGMTVKAKWTINQYTITFDTAGGTAIAPITQDYGTDVTAPGEPSKTGYTFAGWDVKIPATMPAENVTITAKWTINSYTITFDTAGGTAIAPITQDYATAVKAPETPTKTGYTFAGWDVTIPASMPAGDMTITAKWTINRYTITFDTAGGTAIAPITQDYGTDVTAPGEPSKTGYTFAGWDVEIPATMPAENVTIKAKWTINQYTITFDTAGGSAIAPITQDYNTAVTAPANPTKTGYTFAGWDVEIPATMPAENVTITAKWTINQYTITFKNEDGTTLQSGEVAYGTVPAYTGATPTKAATAQYTYTFAGWSPAIAAVTGEATYTATYTSTVNGYTITFEAPGAEGTMAPMEQKYGDTVSLNSNAFHKYGHDFDGWLGSDGKTYADAATVTVTGNLTLTAQWKRSAYTVIWNVDGNQDNKVPYQYGDTIVAPADPQKTGYEFTGWTGFTEGMTMPAQSQEFYAQWTPIVYDIKLDTDGDGTLEKTIRAPYDGALALEDGVKMADNTNTYTFLGWSTEPGGEVLENLPAVSGEASYYAVFEAVPITYTITLHTQGGAELTALTGGYEAKVTLPEATGKTGYTFVGWAETTDPNAATMAAGSEFTILTNDDLYAVWQINTYNLTWIVDGVETVVPYEYGAAVAPVADPQKEGHTFTGWDVEIPEYMPANNVTITAIFEINTYTIGWDTNEDGEADVTDTVNWNVVPVYDAEKHGEITKESTVDTVYTFSGWTVEPVAATDDVVYTAKFDSAVRQYTITWVIDGVESTTSVAYGQTPVAPEATKAEDNYNTYAFSSWNTAEDGTGTGIETVTGEATYYALFTSTAKVYTLTLDLDGGHIGEQNVLIFEGGYGDAIEAPATDPEKTGYTFMGWSEEIPAELTVTKTITAQWKINQYTITFDTVGAGEIDAITQDYGTAIEAPADPIKVGHTFDGWAPALPTTMPAEDMDLVAIWQVNQYSITFDTRGGTEISPITGDYGSVVDAPADPQRAGYTFLGWDAEIPATIPAEDVVLTAVWEANENKIELYTEKGGSLYASIVAKTDENVADQLPADPTKEGHTFGGWVDANGESYALSDIMPTSSMVLYAKWNVSEYTITFDLGGGMIGDQTTYTIVQDFETEVTAPADPVRAGYTFQGWFVKGADGSEYGYQIPETMPAKNETVFAKWSANRYTVTYQDDAGNVLFTQTLYCDEVITVPTITRKGYTFVGWQDTIPGVMPAGDLVLTSIWTVNQYTITFIADGGSEVEAIVADYGAVLTAPEAPTKEGYTFQGWSPEMPETMPAQNLTLTAQWALSEYTVTWLNHDGSELAKDIVKHGELPVYQGAEPVRAETPELSYTFSGWTPEVVEATGNATYTAVYEETRKAYTVTFLFENGQENLVVTVVNGDAIEIPAAPEKDGYVFNGWNPAVPEIMPAENITATAQWVKEVYTITFDPDNGMEPVAVTTGWGESYSKPADPVKEGYTFAGWANAEGEIIELPTVMPEENLELKASWTVNRYTITFNTDGGSEIEAITLDYGAVVTAPAAPEKDGYTFMGWTPALPETMPATDLAVTAQWKWTYTGWFDEDAGTTYLIDGQKAYFGQWKEIEGTTYYFDDQSYIVSDLYTTTAPDGSHVGIFVFDESGKFLVDKTGVHISNAGDTYWVENGEVILDKGLTRVVLADGEVNYYFFGEDGKAAKDTILWVEKNNGYLVKWDYTFDANGVIIHHEDTSRMGVHEDENGVECYYIDGVKVHWGLFQIGEYYYYARSDASLVKNKTYWISITNGLLEEGAYKFDELGRIVIEPVKDGIYEEDGSLYYYEDGRRTYRGLFEGDGVVGEDGCYYYANTQGEIINSCRYWITKTNGLLVEGSYDFDEKGRIVLEGKYTGFVEESDGIYYYLDGVKTYAGLIYVDGYYYYVNASCKLIVGRSYWVTRTNGLLPEGSYTFDAQGHIILEEQDDSVVKNGIVEENGVKYYYVDGVKTFAGLIVIDGDYYYVNSSCKVVVGRSYWITKTNGLMPEGSYTFDADGKMIL